MMFELFLFYYGCVVSNCGVHKVTA